MREFNIPGIGLVDLVCVDDQDTLTIIECKLAANPQIRREVVGQIIAYEADFRECPTTTLTRPSLFVRANRY